MMLVRLGGVLFVFVSVYCFSVGCVIAALYSTNAPITHPTEFSLHVGRQ